MSVNAEILLGRKFVVSIIKPSFYDHDGYVVQWYRSWPSPSLGCVTGLAFDSARKNILGDDVEIIVDSIDEQYTTIKVDEIADKIKKASEGGLVCLVGVMSCQYPRAVDLAAQFKERGAQVAIGGPHVSGVVATAPNPEAELKDSLDLGVSLFAGEAENGRFDKVLQDSFNGTLSPIYNYLAQTPSLPEEPVPVFTNDMICRSSGVSCIDTGRGCPFDCDFCTIINIYGRKMRSRSIEDIEKFLFDHAGRGTKYFFITDDNFARGKLWEKILDRLIELRDSGRLAFNFTIQVDISATKIPRLVEKAKLAGCDRVFIGLETVNQDNLDLVGKNHNDVSRYKEMLQPWRDAGIMVQAAYIIGFPNDTPESIEKDIKLLMDELPIDSLTITMMVPLPGSALYKNMKLNGEWVEPDFNKYHGNQATLRYDGMSGEELESVYNKVWEDFYSLSNAKTVFIRKHSEGYDLKELMKHFVIYYRMFKFENIHPIGGGLWRKKERTIRRPGMPIENPLTFYSKRITQILKMYLSLGIYAWNLRSIHKQVLKKGSLKTG